MKIYKYLAAILLALAPLLSRAQKPENVEMADNFRKEGKIYVVVAVVLIILTGIFVYLFMLDKKVSKIENQLKQK